MKEYTYREMLQVSESSSCNSEYTNNEEQSLPQQRVLEQPSGITVTPPVSNLVIKQVDTFLS